MTYRTTDEFMDCYTNGTLSEFNEQLFGDYIDFNFHTTDLFDEPSVDLSYINGCNCIGIADDDDTECNCSNNVNYSDDEFMWSKIPMFPKNRQLQQYYDTILGRRIFKNKIFYYLPNGCKSIYTCYIDKTINDTYDIDRTITYTIINDQLVLVADRMNAWFGKMFENYHTPESPMFDKYKDKLQQFQLNNQLDIDYSVRTIIDKN